ncbi:hypothetical protein ACJ2A9_09600 [Anaerobacillus sp. MEB173]|uniref:hypothetical protein n=1 Tax=Anaerobacillus sp. MEB173 TaxID=3383345 RepID=UPI003F914707
MNLSHEESLLIEKSIVLPLVRTVLEKDLKTIQNSPFKIKGPYIQLVDQALLMLSKESRSIKQETFKRGIKVVKGLNDGTFSRYEYFNRGYHGELNYLNAELRNKTTRMIEKYFLSQYKEQ